MTPSSKLFLYSTSVPDDQFHALDRLTGKTRAEIRMGMIFNAMDVVPGTTDWIHSLESNMREKGYQVRRIDLRTFSDPLSTPVHLDDLDVIWVSGGHTYYLRWILSSSGADSAIQAFVRRGGVFAGWSAGAIIAGPTLQYFDLMGDDPIQAPTVIMEGLGLTDKVIIPHKDYPMFRNGAIRVTERLLGDGYKVLPLRDDEVFVQGEGVIHADEAF